MIKNKIFVYELRERQESFLSIKKLSSVIMFTGDKHDAYLNAR